MDNPVCRLLVVEDDPIDQMALKRFLKKEQLAFQTTMADSVAQAREQLALGCFDVVVADYRLGDGIALDLFELLEGVPVIVVTGGGDEAVAIQAMKAGAYDYLIKDRERNYLNLLPVVVQQALDHRAAEQRVRRNHDLQSTINVVLRISLQDIPLRAQLERILGHVLAIPWLSHGARGCIFLSDGTPASELFSGTCQGLDQVVLQRQMQFFQQHIHATPEVAARLLQSGVIFEQSKGLAGVGDHPAELLPNVYRTPIVSGSKALGLWLLQVPAGEAYSDEVAAFLMAIADTLAGIIERKRMEEALYEAKERAETASRAKSEFLANISHELRTPMNAIIGMTDLARHSDNPDERQMFLGIVQDSSQALLNLLNGIIDYARIETNRLSLSRVPFDLRQVLLDVVDGVTPKAKEKGLRLRWRLHPALCTRLLGDPFYLRQVIQQLAVNAIKFTERGSVTIDAGPYAPAVPAVGRGGAGRAGENLSVGKEGDRPTEVRFTVSVVDTGIGIAQEWQSAIFDAFTQVDGSSTRKIGGTGLGLAISKRLVELMDGRIGVESVPGQGSRFFVHLALERSTEADAPGAAPFGEGIPIAAEAAGEVTQEVSLAEYWVALERAMAQGDLAQAAQQSGKIRELSADSEVRSKAFHVVLAARRGDLSGARARLEQLRHVLGKLAEGLGSLQPAPPSCPLNR